MRKIGRLLLCASLLASAAEAQVVTGVTTTVGPSGTTTVTTTAEGPSAEKAAADAASARISAATAAVPGSGLSPSTSLSGANAGFEETTLGAATVIKLAARHIAAILPHDKETLLLVGGVASPDTSAWLMFQQRSAGLLAQLKADEKTLKHALGAGQPPAPSPKAESFFSGGGVALAPKVLSYFLTNYQVAGFNITVDDYLLNAALLETGARVTLASQQAEAAIPDEISKPIERLQAGSVAASALVVKATAAQARLANTTGPNAPGAKIQADLIKSLVASLTADIGTNGAFITSLSGGPGVAGNLGAVLQARLVDRAMSAEGGGLLFVKQHSVAGGVITKTNLWSNLGAMPLYTSAGLVVSFVYYPSRANAAAPAPRPTAEVFEVATPYHTAGKVRRLLELESAGACDAPTTEDARKYCPVVYARRPAAR